MKNCFWAVAITTAVMPLSGQSVIKTLNVRGRIEAAGQFSCRDVDPNDPNRARIFGRNGVGIVIVVSAGQNQSNRSELGSWSVRSVLGTDPFHPTTLVQNFIGGKIHDAGMNFGVGHSPGIPQNFKFVGSVTGFIGLQQCPGVHLNSSLASISGYCGTNQSITFEIGNSGERSPVLRGSFTADVTCEERSDESGVITNLNVARPH